MARKEEFTPREFEGESAIAFTFKGYGGYFCISLNAKCIHSVKTESVHIKKLNALIEKYGLIELKS